MGGEVYKLAESEVSNLLVSQKNAILEMVNNREYDNALVCLRVLREMWNALDYGYKWNEINSRIFREINLHSLEM